MWKYWQWRKRQLLNDYILQILPMYPITDEYRLFLEFYEPYQLDIHGNAIELMGRYPLALHFHWWDGWAPTNETIQEVFHRQFDELIYDYESAHQSLDDLARRHHMFIVWLATYYLCIENAIPWTSSYISNTYSLYYEYSKLPHIWQNRLAHYAVTGSLLLPEVSPHSEIEIHW